MRSSSQPAVIQPSAIPFLYLVPSHFAGQRIAMDADRVGRSRQIAFHLSKHLRDETLLELPDGVVEQHPFVDHLLDEPLEAIRDHASSRPVRRRKASMYFARVFLTTSSGSDGTGGCLFHLMRSR